MEQTVFVPNGQFDIPCCVTCCDDQPVRQIVLGVHGIGGSKNDAIQRAIAEEMVMFCDATVRFDFPAHGESPMDSREFNLDTCQRSLLEVIDFAKERWPEAKEYCVLASSFGAYIALLAIDALKEKLGRFKFVLRCPAVRMNKTFLTIARTDAPGLMKKGRIICGYERKMELGYSFYEQLEFNNAVADHDMPMLILQGDADELIDLADIEFFHLLNAKSALVMIPGATHRFNHEGELDMIIDLARDWYLCEEVLLCECD